MDDQKEIFERRLREQQLAHRKAERQWEAQRKELSEKIERMDRRIHQESVQRHQAELRLVLMIQQLPWGVVLEDSDGLLTLANQEYCDLFQLNIAPTKLVGMDLRAMDQNASALFMNPELYIERLVEVRGGTSAALGDTLELTSGDIWLRNSVPVETPDGDHGWLHLYQDITKGRRDEAELQKAIAAGEEANRRTAAFLAAVSHEMRTPLSAVLGLTEVLNERLTGQDERKFLDRIRSNADSLLHLIGDVSDYISLDEGRLRLVEGPLSPARIVRTVVEQLAYQAQQQGLRLVADIDDSLPGQVLGDEGRIRQLLVGLVGNSLKFTSSGTITVRAYRPEAGTLDEVCYEVQDTGIGIPPDMVGTVFDRFYRVDSDAPGTGLGLSICRDLVHLMGGRVGIESDVGKGTRVFFILQQPALAESEPSELDKEAQRFSLHPSANPRRPPSVLLVEDDPDNRLMMARFIERAGFAVQQVDNAQEALQIWQDSPFDALVTDISMPGMDGIELVEKVRELETRANLSPRPTIVVTAHALPEYMERCREVGVDVFLTKPIQGTVLCRALAKVTKGAARVLVADDAPDSRLLLRLCLEHYSSPLEIVLVNSGAAAIEACRAETFSLLLLDVWMPEMGGAEALREIRRLPGYAQTPAIGITGLTEEAELQELVRQGFQRVLRKPIDRPALHLAVREQLRAATVLTRSPVTTPVEAAPTLLQLDVVSDESPQSIASRSNGSGASGAAKSEIHDLIPHYLSRRGADLQKLRVLESVEQFTEIGRIGHTMKGSGSAYGFEAITEMGARLEQAAKKGDRAQVVSVCDELAAFLHEVAPRAGDSKADSQRRV